MLLHFIDTFSSYIEANRNASVGQVCPASVGVRVGFALGLASWFVHFLACYVHGACLKVKCQTASGFHCLPLPWPANICSGCSFCCFYVACVAFATVARPTRLSVLVLAKRLVTATTCGCCFSFICGQGGCQVDRDWEGGARHRSELVWRGWATASCGQMCDGKPV